MHERFDASSFDLIVSNPPFFKVHRRTARFNDLEQADPSRSHEVDARSRNPGASGQAAALDRRDCSVLVHRVDRLEDIFRVHAIVTDWPSNGLRFVYPKARSSTRLWCWSETRNNGSPWRSETRTAVLRARRADGDVDPRSDESGSTFSERSDPRESTYFAYRNDQPTLYLDRHPDRQSRRRHAAGASNLEPKSTSSSPKTRALPRSCLRHYNIEKPLKSYHDHNKESDGSDGDGILSEKTIHRSRQRRGNAA
ncbi:MAG: hypothetical protein MZU97_22640 [Bacillus subtilis]|nr:hypothetical protein [Bacillus subtilis]